MSSSKKTTDNNQPKAKQNKGSATGLRGNPKVFLRAFLQSFVWVLILVIGCVYIFYKMDGFPAFKHWAKTVEVPSFSAPEDSANDEGEEVIPYAGAEMSPAVNIENLTVKPAEIVSGTEAEPSEKTDALEEIKENVDVTAATELAALRKQLADVQMNLIKTLAKPTEQTPVLSTDFLTALANLHTLEAYGGNPDFALKALRQSTPEALKPAVQNLSVALPKELIRTADVVTKAQQAEVDTTDVSSASPWVRWIKIEKLTDHGATNDEDFNRSRQACVQEILAATSEAPACDAIGVDISAYLKQTKALNTFWQQVEEIQ